MNPTGLLGKAGLDDSNGGEGCAASTVLLILDKRNIFVEWKILQRTTLTVFLILDIKVDNFCCVVNQPN